ncbi:DUF4214 domain-containing protein [Azotobacter beijerinckii]|uniref:DUF4214 domain-containing protein n=1 Tax=Azotobacter beijerinckii TaxID=170623 RepID=UPI0029535856|nr:DUF4214 domain-containing protein [Azotobacter beijerinckii]MDV7211427.1 DUF4214 domain-containing protein [Azotobacter beijerinckii]
MASNTTLSGGLGNDTLTTGDGNDSVTGGFGNDLVSTGAGNDTIHAGLGHDTVDGGEGFDLVQINGNRDNFDFEVENGRLVARSSLIPAYSSTSVTNVEIFTFTSQLAGTKQVVVATNEDQASAMRLYQALFDRTPDIGGAEYWLGQVDQGLPLTDIADAFLNSTEFQNNGELSDDAFVDLLYQNALGRSADEAGKAFWLEQLQSFSRAEVALDIVGSPEAADTIDSVLLPTGVATSGDDTIDLTVGQDTIDAGKGFDIVQVKLASELASSDYSFSVDDDSLVATHNSDSSLSFTLKNTEVVSFGTEDNVVIVDNEDNAEAMRLYEALFDRSADVDGAKYWLDQLDQDAVSPTDIANAFLNSTEFQDANGSLDNDAFVELLYQNTFGRAADTDGKAFWLDALNSDHATQAEVAIAIVGSPEAADTIENVQIIPANQA